MSVSLIELNEPWKLEALLLKHPGLRLVPSTTTACDITGAISFALKDDRGAILQESYDVTISVPDNFPVKPPRVREKGRIPHDYHKLSDGCLCLGTRMDLELRIAERPTLLDFVDDFVVPYLYGYTYFSRYGKPAYGERSHGVAGVREFIAELFESRKSSEAEHFLYLASLKKRKANKLECPCGKGKRLGKCHNDRVNELRSIKGRTWFKKEYDKFLKNPQK